MDKILEILSKNGYSNKKSGQYNNIHMCDLYVLKEKPLKIIKFILKHTLYKE